MLRHNCATATLACVTTIGRSVGADAAAFGTLVRRGAAFEITITRLDLATGKQQPWSGTTVNTAEDVRALARRAHGALFGGACGC
jgi:hypothetical protein